jgi:hypothetical protein
MTRVIQIVESRTKNFLVRTAKNPSAPVRAISIFRRRHLIDKNVPTQYSTQVKIPVGDYPMSLYYEAHSSTEEEALARHYQICEWIESRDGIFTCIIAGTQEILSIKTLMKTIDNEYKERNQGFSPAFRINPDHSGNLSLIADIEKDIEYLLRIVNIDSLKNL